MSRDEVLTRTGCEVMITRRIQIVAAEFHMYVAPGRQRTGLYCEN
jgi:hypothetical protein